MPGKSALVTATPAVTAGAYAAGAAIGGVFELPLAFDSEFSGVLLDAQIKLRSAQTAPLTLYLFRGGVTHGLASAIADNAAPAWSADDLGRLLAVVSFGTAQAVMGARTLYESGAIGKPLVGGFTSLWGVLIPAAALTLVSTADVTISAGILKD